MFFTAKQLQILNFIRDYRRAHAISPTLEENMARSIELTEEDASAAPVAGSYPLLGTIAAGRPIEAVEDRQEVSLLDFVPPNADCYFLQVTGTSLIEDHITEGDFVLVDRNAQPRNGEIVVAIVGDGEATLKRFYKEDGRVRLQPANQSMMPIYPDALQVRGVVRAIFRRV